MPPSAADHHHHDATPAVPPKPDTTKLVSLILKAVIMTLITTSFFLLIGLASLLFLPLLLLTSLHRHRHRRRNKADRSTLFSPKDVKKLPQFRFPPRLEPSEIGPEREPQPECVVCLEGFRQGQWCRRLVGCGHVFHRKCVDTWLVKVAACPTCRTPVRLSYDEHH